LSEDKPYKGIRYEIPCVIDPEDALTFRAFEDGAGNVVLGVEIGHHYASGYDADASVVIGIEYLTELHNAINGALGAVATNGIRLIEEKAEKERAEAFKARWGLNLSYLDGPEPS
jgi:hypothetical protein